MTGPAELKTMFRIELSNDACSEKIRWQDVQCCVRGSGHSTAGPG